MAASFQRLILLFAILSVALIGVVLAALDRLWWTAPAVVFALSVYPLILGIELILACSVGRPSVSRPAFSGLLKAWVGEIRAGGKTFGWEQPFRTNVQPDYLPQSVHGLRGVVLVHGLFCNRGFWNSWMRYYRAQGNVPFIAVTLEPLFCSIDEYVPILESAIARVTAVTGRAPVVVAHSMGGLVVRRWLSAQESKHRVRRVITVGTPHVGTWLARFASGSNGRQMAVGSEWLQDLTSTSRPEDAHLFTCFLSNCDNVVFPAQNATLPGADNRMLSGNGHVQLAAHPAVKEEVNLWLEDGGHFPGDDVASPGGLSMAANSPSLHLSRHRGG